MSELTLRGIETTLLEGGYDGTIIGDPEELVGEHLRIFLGTDAEGGECVLDIAVKEDLLGDPRLYKNVDEVPSFIKVEFQAILDWTVIDLAMEQTASLLHFINRSIDLPGFELNELDGRVGYRYIHLTATGDHELPLVRALVGGIKLFIDIFGSVIRQVGQGEKTFDDIIDVIIDHAKEMGLGDDT